MLGPRMFCDVFLQKKAIRVIFGAGILSLPITYEYE